MVIANVEFAAVTFTDASSISTAGVKIDPGARVSVSVSAPALSTAVIPVPELFILYLSNAITSSTLATGLALIPPPTSAATYASPMVALKTSVPTVT